MSWDEISEALFVDRAAPNPEAPVTPFVALQRVVVRLLFDPAFVERVYAQPETALAGLEVDRDLVKQLLTNDRRLWNADRLRRSRSLKILMDEFKVTSTLVLAERGELAFLDAFFGSSFFHEAVKQRRYMALAFAAYLEDAIRRRQVGSRHLRAVLGLEAAMARSRRLLREARRGLDAALRGVGNGPSGERWAAQPGVLAHFAPANVIGVVQHVEKYLFQIGQVPALALCRDAPRPEPLPEIDERSPTPFLLEPRPGGKVDLSEVDAGYARVVEACERPVDDEALASAVAPHGITSERAREMAGSLLEAGVLRRVGG